MQHYEVQRSDEGLEIRATLRGRLAAATVRFVTWTPLVMAGMSVLFLPDYLGQYRQDEPVTGLFWAALAALAIFAGLIAAAVRLMRRDVWLLSPEREAVVFATRPWVGRARESHIDWAELDSVEWKPRRMGRRSTLSLRFDGRPPETVAATRLGGDAIVGVFERLNRYLSDHRPEVDVQTNVGDGQRS